MLSFIVTYRDRKDELKDYIHFLRLFYPDSEIVVSEQRNDKPFMQGQLINLAFRYSHGDIVIFMDLDLRFIKFVDFTYHMDSLKKPFMGYNRIINYDKDNTFLGLRMHSNMSHGGCCVFTRKQFEKSNGYSNLMCGWGGEDDILNKRIHGYGRVQNVLRHMEHARNIDGDHYAINVRLYHTDKDRKKKFDGLEQTIGNLIEKRIENNVLYLAFDIIGVTPNFMYKDLLREELQDE